jgi:hypothetical protein
VLTPKLVPAVTLAEVSALNTTGNLTTPKTSPTIPPTSPMAKPAIARITGLIRSTCGVIQIRPNKLMPIIEATSAATLHYGANL